MKDEEVLEKYRKLPSQKKQEFLDFLEFLESGEKAKKWDGESDFNKWHKEISLRNREKDQPIRYVKERLIARLYPRETC